MQDIKFHAVLSEQGNRFHYLIKGTMTTFIMAIDIVQLAWSVQAKTDQKIVLLEENRPFIVERL